MIETEEKIKSKKVYKKEKYGVKRKIVIKSCKVCDKAFDVKLSHFKMEDKNRETCSNKCSGILQAQKRNQEGENNPNWKGGLSEHKMRYKEKQEERYPKKVRARKMVASAKETGKLSEKPCEKCGSEENLQAHHTDYDQPLNVTWLCQEHHIELHNKEQDTEEYLTER